MANKVLNLPNCLSLTRIVAAPVIVGLLYLELWTGARFWAYASCVLFIIASATDLFDGMIARQQNTITNLGKFLDPLADKLLICSILIMLVRLGPEWRVPAWAVIIIVGREVAVTGMRAVASDMGKVIAADKFGKLKTVLQIFAMVPLLWHYPFMGYDVRIPGQILFWAAVALTVISGANYLYSFYKTWLVSEEN